MTSLLKSNIFFMLTAASSISCSTSDNAMFQESPKLSFQPSSSALKATAEKQNLEKSKTVSTTKQQSAVACVNCPVISNKLDTFDQSETDDIAQGLQNTLRSERSIENPESSNRSGSTYNQTSVLPNDDLDLVQLPDEADYQAVNSIWTSNLPNNVAVNQTAEYKNVVFNQLNSPDALHTINSVRHNDPSKNGQLNQNFKFKNLEMIQRDVGNGIHSMNYVGD